MINVPVSQTVKNAVIAFALGDGTKDVYFAGDELPASYLLNKAKGEKSGELYAAYHAEVEAGVDSGGNNYGLDDTTKIHLIGAVLGGQPVRFKTRAAGSNAPKRMTDHTPTQLQQVLADGAARIQALEDQLEARLDAVNAATTVAEVEAVSW